MSTKELPTQNTKHVFHYDVETLLWKNPFNKAETDELEYAKQRQQNTYHHLKRFSNANPLEARGNAFNYLRSMLEVLCESLEKPFKSYWQALQDLQPLFRANHPLAHQKVGKIQFDDDLLYGVSLTLRVEKGKKRDRVAIFNLGVFDDDHKEEDILYDVVHSIVELERERRYYKLCGIPVNSEKIDLIDIGLPVVEVIPSLMSWQEFPDTFRKTDIDDAIDTTDIYDRLFEKLI